MTPLGQEFCCIRSEASSVFGTSMSFDVNRFHGCLMGSLVCLPHESRLPFFQSHTKLFSPALLQRGDEQSRCHRRSSETVSS
jgi:hypothetical protein